MGSLKKINNFFLEVYDLNRIYIRILLSVPFIISTVLLADALLYSTFVTLSWNHIHEPQDNWKLVLKNEIEEVHSDFSDFQQFTDGWKSASDFFYPNRYPSVLTQSLTNPIHTSVGVEVTLKRANGTITKIPSY